MSWPTFTVDVTQNSNQIKIYGPVPASEIPAGFEVIIGNVSNLEVSYGTAIMYDGSNNPYSHLYLVRPYTGPSVAGAEAVIKPTGALFNDVVDIFRNGSNQASQLMANYRQFVEGTEPIIHQPLDENAPPLSIDPLPKMNADVAAVLQEVNNFLQTSEIEKNQTVTALQQDVQNAINQFDAAAGTAATHDVTTSSTDATAGRLLKVGDLGLGCVTDHNGIDRKNGFTVNQIPSSISDYPTGLLIRTALRGDVSEGVSFLLTLTGKAYNVGLSHDVRLEGYFYNDQIINVSGINVTGGFISNISVFTLNNQLCFWVPPTPYWNSFFVTVQSTVGGDSRNYAYSLEHSTYPTGTTKDVNVALEKGFNSRSSSLHRTSGQLTVGTNDESDLNLKTNNKTRLKITPSGNQLNFYPDENHLIELVNRVGTGLRLYPTGATLGIEITPTGNTLIGTTTDNGIDKLQVAGGIKIGSGYGNSSPRNTLTYGLGGFGNPGDWGSDSLGDKLVLWSNGIDVDSRVGFSLADSLWVKGMGTTAHNAFAVHGSTANAGSPNRLFTVRKSGAVLINTDTDNGADKLQVNGSVSFRPLSSVNPTNNGELIFEATSNTSVKVKLRGSDGVVRSATLTLS